jgi:hypothetical protein
MKIRYLKLAAPSLALMLSSQALAGPIVYTVNQSVGAGSVTGTITTDGTIGNLDVSNFVAWNLLLSIPGQSFALDQTNSVVLSYQSGFYGPANNDVTATAQNILFNFDGTDGGYLGFQQGPYSGAHYWCSATITQGFDCAAGGQTIAPISVFSAYEFQAFRGNVVLATAAGSVPEPASWAMMLAGFATLGAAARRRRAAGVARA